MSQPTVLVIQEFQLDQHVVAQFGKSRTSILSATQDEAVLVIACLHTIQRLLKGVEGVLLIVHFFDLEAV